MKKKSYLKVLAPTLALSLMMTACSSKDDKAGEKKETEKKKPQVVKILESSEIPTMDSAMAEDTISFTMLNNTMEGLYRLDQNQEAIPGLAEGKPEVSKDGLTYKVKLRDATWSNGDPITANDFVFAWQRAVDPKTASPYGPYMMSGKIANATEIAAGKLPKEELGIKALSDKELEIKLAKPIPFFESLMAFGTFYPQNKKFVESKADKYASNSDNSISAGPFIIKGWDGPEDVNWELEKNPKYWDAKSVKVEKLTFNVQKDPQAALNMFQAGEADITPKLAKQGVISQIEKDKQLNRWLEPSVFWLKFNEKNKALSNVNIRKALAMSFDKEALAKDVLNNGSIPANYFVPAEFVKDDKGKDFRTKTEYLKYDEKKAKEYWEKGLAEIGQKEVTLRYTTQDTETAKLSDAFITDQMKKHLPGLKLELIQIPFPEKLKREEAMDYDILFSGWGPDYADPMAFADLYTSTSAKNKMAYASEKYDKLIKEADTTNDNAKRFEAMREAEKTLLEDAALAPIYQRAANVMVRDNIKGFTHHLFGPDYSYKWLEVK